MVILSRLTFYCFLFLGVTVVAQKERFYEDPTLGDTMDTLMVVIERSPEAFFRKIDSVEKGVSEKDRPLFLIESHFLKGTLYRNLRDFDQLFFHYEKVKELSTKHGYRQYIAEVYREMGDEYFDNEMPDKAAESYDKAIEIYKEFGNEEGVIVCTYDGFIENLKEEYDLSNRKLKKKLPLFQEKAYVVYQDALMTIAENYMKLNQLDSAFVYAQKLDLSKAGPNADHFGAFKDFVSVRYYLRQKNIDSANYFNARINRYRFDYEHDVYYFENAIEIAKLSGNVNLQLAYADSLSIANKKQLQEMERQNVNDTESLYEYENRINQKEATLFQRTFGFIGAIAIVLLITFFVFRKYQKNKKIQAAQILKMQNELQLSMEELTEVKREAVKDNLDKIADRIEKLAKKHELTDRETDVLLQITKGLNNKEIAAELFVSVNTVKYHMRNLYEKLDIKKRTEIASKLMYEKQ